MKPLRLIVAGARGRMGSRVAALAQSDKRFVIAAGVVREGRSSSIYPFPYITESELSKFLKTADVLIDFSTPEAAARLAALAAKVHKPIVIGTTGLSSGQLSSIRSASHRTAVFLSPNFSVGMNLLFLLAQRAATALPHYDASISEIHHNKKKDSPSGTALRLVEAVRRGNSKSEVPIVSQRLGTVVGDHQLTLAGPFERIELTHRAESRDVFARGALEAAWWVRAKKKGLYDMSRLVNV